MSSIEERIQKFEANRTKADKNALNHSRLCLEWNNKRDILTEKIERLKAKQEKKVD